MRTAKVSRPLVSLYSLHLPCRRCTKLALLHCTVCCLACAWFGPAGGWAMRMGHESMKNTWECRKSYTQEKRTMLAEPAKIRHFPLAPVSVGWVPDRAPAGAVAPAKDAERCAGGLPTENKAREGSRRRHVVRCWYCRPGRQGPGWYCCKFQQGVAGGTVANFNSALALTSPQPVLHELLINGVGAVIRKLAEHVPAGCFQRVAIVAE